MPIYEYRCRACGETFEHLRSSADADLPAPCPSGHEDTARLLSMIARQPGTSSAGASLPLAGGGGGGGGGSCCGGGCCG